MHKLGMTTSVDAAGNLRGLFCPTQAASKRLLLGSHVDTVPDAGAYDGVLGVVLAIEWVAISRELKLPLNIEVIAFSEEEGVRYGVPFLGSNAVTGTFDPSLLALRDAEGVRMDAAMHTFGLDPSRIGEAVLDENVLGFVEIHIEQGPVLEAENLALAVVEGIVGQSRLELSFTGEANHAGSTPMHLRRDALAAAAEWICAVESTILKAQTTKETGVVATVGHLHLEPNAENVIPGIVRVSLDVRHMDSQVRSTWTTELIRIASSIAERRGIGFEWQQRLDQPEVKMDPQFSAQLLGAVEAAGYPLKTMPSGAGHDAMVMAAKVPTAMLFLRSLHGISHNPAESVLEDDVAAALNVGREFLLRLAEDIG
jgi:allantoate deiminase